MRKKKQKGPATGESTGPKRKDESKHILKDRRKELDSQEAKLFMKFAESYPPADMKIDVALAIWEFLKFLKKGGYKIIHEETVFCVPLSKLVSKGDLK